MKTVTSFPPSRPLVSVVGPTATGKSGFALQLAEKLLVDGYFSTVAIISADSRQVYRGLEVVSGADIPADFELAVGDDLHFVKKSNYGEIQLHGVSMIEPTAEWSLATFQKWAMEVLAETWRHGGLAIVVGGTGLYHARLFADELANLPGPDQALREIVAKMTLEELQQKVHRECAEDYKKLTHDDAQNKRRLIRVLEKKQVHIESSEELLKKTPDLVVLQPSSHHQIGLNDSIENIERKIAQRVAERVKFGAVTEVQRLVSTVSDHSTAVFSATGVRELLLFIQEKIELEQALQLWVRRERQYAKRQQTWWKKNQPAWQYSVADEGWAKAAQNQVLASFK